MALFAHVVPENEHSVLGFNVMSKIFEVSKLKRNARVKTSGLVRDEKSSIANFGGTKARCGVGLAGFDCVNARDNDGLLNIAPRHAD